LIKRIVFLRKRPDLSDADFAAYWSGSHAELVLQLPNIRGLRINIVESWSPQEARWDGIGEVWFDDVSALQEAYEREPFRSALADDRAAFAIADRQVCLVREQTILAPASHLWSEP
jgi:uncharacterized protein (TIGR02118 family)